MKRHLTKVFFCAGARNHPLLKEFEEEEVLFEVDERIASFKALGLTKVKGPVGICTTSGTAVSECLSAMLEAYYSGAPLVLITGDRPKKMHGTGAPQTIDHEIITRGARRSFHEVTLEEFQTMDLRNLEYPAHINVLIDDTKDNDFKAIHQNDLGSFKIFLKDKKKPLFILSHSEKSLRPVAEELSKRKLSFYSESLSGARDLSFIKTEKKLIELFKGGFFDSVIRIGHTPLSKVWRLIETAPLPVYHFDSRGLSGMSFGEVLKITPEEMMSNTLFLEALDSLLPYPVADETPWKLSELNIKYPDSEIAYFQKLNDLLPSGSSVYLGNSLVIRFFELTQSKNFDVYGNRGVNGIDGQLATAIGLSQGLENQLYVILGDVTALYDLTSMKDLPKNVTLIIMNNRGGRIFDMLGLDKRIVMEHEFSFEKIAKAFGLTYSNSFDDLNFANVIELFPNKESSAEALKEWMK